ncbi:MAG: hypothetical protein ABII82_09345 [Verrucomicrobiota bacterium]
MAGFETPKKTTELGEALIAELTKENHSTTLSRWVAHYLAEQMEEIKKAKGQDRIKAKQRCFAAILQLWQNRASVPNGLHPFAGFEPVFRALEGISPDRRLGYYVGQIDEKRATDKRSDTVLEMARFIQGTDQAARILIEAALEQAIDHAQTPRTKTYLRSVQAKAKDGDVIGVSRLMSRRRYLETLDPADEADELKQLWEKRVEALGHFIEVATAIQRDFQDRLSRISTIKKTKKAG